MTPRPPTRRLAVLLTHPVQYFKPVFQGLAADPAIALQVVFGCDHGSTRSLDPDFGVAFAWDSAPTEGFPHTILSPAPLAVLSQPRGGLALARQASRTIAAWRPDAVLIFSYSPLFITASSLLLASRGLRLWLRAETTDQALERSPWKERLRSLALRRYYQRFDHVFPIGRQSEAHYQRLGVEAARRTTARYAVDQDFFAAQVRHWRPRREALRAELGLPPDGFVLLFVGKLSPVKDPLLIPAALEQLRQDPARLPLWQRLHVVVVGDGVLRPALEDALDRTLPGRHHAMGFQNQRELGRFYALADALLLPSRQGETWGLVVNEALQFGCGVICSDRVGCAADLVNGQPWGRVHASGEAGELAAAIASLAAEPPERQRPPAEITLPHPRDLVQAIQRQLRSL
ncbi:MAG: glycosyltransferase family 4 protein [Cyanobacteriota bacterium]|nr:glycosyltransferase family 4 protein [Cyanobacteriota bacterium]